MKLNMREVFLAAAAIVLMTVVLIDPSLAQDTAATAGGVAKSTLEEAITGNIGFFIGLGVTILGLWTWIIKQETGAGVVMIIGGVLITMAPGIFNGAKSFIGGVVTSFSGTGGTTKVQ